MSDEKLGVQMYTTGLGDLICDWSDSRSAIPVAEIQIVPGGEDSEAEEGEDSEAEEAEDVDPVPDPEDDAVNALLLEISEQENQMPDDLPSGITAADVGHASLSIPVFYSEEDYPGPNVIESHQEEAKVVERLFIELIEDAFDCWA